jgi:hypothetical protein
MGKARPPGERDSHKLHCIFIHVSRTRRHLSSFSPQISTACSGCLGFCANFLTASNPVQESIHYRGVVRSVQAFAQTFSRGKNCQGGFCQGIGWPAMFRVFRLLPKLSHEAKVSRWNCQRMGWPATFRVFRLLPKLFQEAKVSRWTIHGMGGRSCSRCSGFCPNFLTRQTTSRWIARGWVAGHVQHVQTFCPNFLRGTRKRHMAFF